MIDLTQFSLASIIKKLKEINPAIQLEHARPFPKEKARWLSCYQFFPQYPEVYDDGSVRGGLSQLVASLVDFSFLRSIAADAYSIFGGPCYDPTSLFLLDLFRYLEAVKNIKDLCQILHDPQRGRIYRRSAGLADNWVPCQATFTNFRARLGETRYQEIFHALVTLVERLGLVTYRISSTDGTLYPSAARYRGCTYFCNECARIQIDNVADKVHDRILYRIQDPAKIITGQPCHVRTDCPSTRFPPDVERPKIDILTFTLEAAPDELSTLDRNNLKLFRVEDQLTQLGLTLKFPQSNVHTIAVSSLLTDPADSFFIRCPKLPYDTDARIGVRRDPANPDRKQKIFGYNAVIATSIESQLGLELPVACRTIAGNAEEGNQFIPLHDQIRRFHSANTRLHLTDAKYDELHNYEYARSQGAIPLIDYNPRNENLTRDALIARGYDRNGWPFVPYCQLLTRPNGFDSQARRLSFACFKQCTKSPLPEHAEKYRHCPHRAACLGFATHVSIAQHPRLILEIPRGSERYHKLHALRSASERTNSTLKADLDILVKPPVRSLRRASVVSQMAVITTLLCRVARFIINITIAQRKFRATGNQHWFDQLSPPEVPAFVKPFAAVN